MDLKFCTDDRPKPEPLSSAADIQDRDVNWDSLSKCPSGSSGLEILTGDSSHVLDAEENSTFLQDTEALEQNALTAQSMSPLNNSETCMLFFETTAHDKDLTEWDCFDTQPVVPLDGAKTCQSHDPVAAAVSMAITPATVPSRAEPLSHSCVNDFILSASCKSDDFDAVGQHRSSSNYSNCLESDTMTEVLSDLYIFESESKHFTLCPDPGAQDTVCSECKPLLQTTAAGKQCTERLETSDSSVMMTNYEQEVFKDHKILLYESDDRGSMSEEPAVDECYVAQENSELTGLTIRNDSPIELWLDACQYFAGENVHDRNLSVSSVMPKSMSNTTSDFFLPSVSPEETQISGYSTSACDVIGWSFEDNKSWGAPVERWSSVDSWASALSDWTEIISSPPEDLTAAFTEIGAEIDALTQALAEVTTKIDIGQQGETTEDILTKSIMGVQDMPLDAQNITDSSVFSDRSCLTCCPEGEVQEKEGFEDMFTTKVKLENITGCQPELKLQSMSSCEAMRYTERPSVESRQTFELDLLDRRSDSFEADVSSNVVLKIVEDTDMEFEKESTSLLKCEPNRENKCEVKDEASFSSLDLAAEQDTGRTSAPPVTLKVDHQGNDVLGFNVLGILAPADVHVPNESGQLDLNVYVLPKTLEDIDGAGQVEPLWGCPQFIMPSVPLRYGSALVTQASSSSLNGEQRATGWALNRDSVCDPNEALGCQSKPDDISDFSSESTEDITHSKKRDSSTDQESDEVAQFSFHESKTIFEESRDLSYLAVIPDNHFTVCVEKQVACFTLDLFDPFVSFASKTSAARMPHKTHKSKKDRSTGHSHGAQTSRKQENLQCKDGAEQPACTFKENFTGEQETRLEQKGCENVIEAVVVPQKEIVRRHSKKKKKHSGKSTTESLNEVENDAQTDKARTDLLKEKQVSKDTEQPVDLQKTTEQAEPKTKDKYSAKTAPNDADDSIKKRRLSQDKFGKLISSLESKLTKGDSSKPVQDQADAGATRRKAYSDVVKQKSVKPKQDLKVVLPIQAGSVSGDPQSLCLWCQFSNVLTDHTVTWRKDGAVQTEIKRSAGDESRASLTISNASHKDLGKYQCELKNPHGRVTLDFLLTYELLSEVVVPTTPKTIPSVPVEVEHEEESIHCSRLMFKDDFLAEQYFGESHSASIVTEKIHFGEGMHRRAFRTTLQNGQIPLLVPGHSCVLKVHNAISYGTNNNEELVQKNFNLAVEECQVQNTAREYIKAYTAAAGSFEAFGPIPEIIPIYLVHRPSNDIPYATLEEELFGDFVKYSVKDGKEINLMRKDSEAGQKCCAFQHWVYHHTEGNLLVTDMQGVGMKLTDVGIATCKKGYKGFKGNCATSFIDQFKALHQCNRYCEILGLKSLQPKPKKTAPAPKSKAQPGAIPKKKVFEPSMKGKS